MMLKKSPTGCRPAQLFGIWLIEPEAFRKMYAQAMRVDLVALGQAKQLAARAAVDDQEDQDEDDDGDSPYVVENGIAMLSITGPMTKYQTSFQEMFGGTSTLQVRRQVRAVKSDPSAYGALIYVDSPGGTVDGTKALADDIMELAAVKPCVAFVDGMACSAAYWCASQASAVYATATSLVGSIGTRLRLEDTSKMFAQQGVKVHELTSGPMKAAAADGTPITDDQVDYFQGIVDDLQTYFAAGVQQGRKLSADQMKQVSDGRVFVAEKAKAAGLIDQVGTIEQARQKVQDLYFFGPNRPNRQQ